MNETMMELLQSINNNINEIAYISESYIANMNNNLSKIEGEIVTNNTVTKVINELESNNTFSNISTLVKELLVVVGGIATLMPGIKALANKTGLTKRINNLINKISKTPKNSGGSDDSGSSDNAGGTDNSGPSGNQGGTGGCCCCCCDNPGDGGETEKVPEGETEGVPQAIKDVTGDSSIYERIFGELRGMSGELGLVTNIMPKMELSYSTSLKGMYDESKVTVPKISQQYGLLGKEVTTANTESAKSFNTLSIATTKDFAAMTEGIKGFEKTGIANMLTTMLELEKIVQKQTPKISTQFNSGLNLSQIALKGFQLASTIIMGEAVAGILKEIIETAPSWLGAFEGGLNPITALLKMFEGTSTVSMESAGVGIGDAIVATSPKWSEAMESGLNPMLAELDSFETTSQVTMEAIGLGIDTAIIGASSGWLSAFIGGLNPLSGLLSLFKGTSTEEVVEAAEGIGEAIDEGSPSWLRGFIGGLDPVIEFIGTWGSKVIGIVGDVVSSVGGIVGRISEFIEPVVETIGTIGETIAGFLPELAPLLPLLAAVVVNPEAIKADNLREDRINSDKKVLDRSMNVTINSPKALNLFEVKRQLEQVSRNMANGFY